MRLSRTRSGRRAREERGCAVILMYHSISRRRPDRFNICVDPELFAEQLQLLHDRFHVVSLGELRSALVGEEPLTRTVAITFDDGYRDNLHVAKPLLEKHGLPATVFVATGFVGSSRDFWWDELETVCAAGGLPLWPLWEELCSLSHQERLERLDALWASTEAARPESSSTLDRGELERMADGGLIRLGAHTVSHPHLSKLPGPQQRQEIEESAAYLTELAGRPVREFCYPHGDLIAGNGRSRRVCWIRDRLYDTLGAGDPRNEPPRTAAGAGHELGRRNPRAGTRASPRLNGPRTGMAVAETNESSYIATVCGITALKRAQPTGQPPLRQSAHSSRSWTRRASTGVATGSSVDSVRCATATSSQSFPRISATGFGRSSLTRSAEARSDRDYQFEQERRAAPTAA